MSEIPAFEPTRSFAYRFVRYSVLPEIYKDVSRLGAEPFLLWEFATPIIGRYLTKEQLELRIPRAQSVGDHKMASILRFYVNFLAKGLDLFDSVGKGYFKVKSDSEVSEIELTDDALEEGDEAVSELGGWMYAFSFPLIMKSNAEFPIKIGKTVGEVDQRVTDQVKGSALFEQPVVLGKWQVKRVGPTELAVHNALKARGKWREDAPGKEWFDTTVAEIESIIRFICG